MSWAKGSDPTSDVGGFTSWCTGLEDIRWPLVNFFPMSRFRIFQEVPASAAAVPGFGGGFYGNGMDLLWIFV